ncbi:Gamma-glutamyltranspeptidase [Arthrobotrys entomopaga]|nr:Gamma-glutamyltranspeptidase [Arthrobotrys entomopaga]
MGQVTSVFSRSHQRDRDEEEEDINDGEYSPLIPGSRSSSSNTRTKSWMTSIPSILTIFLISSLAIFFIYFIITQLTHHRHNSKDKLQEHLIKASHGAVASDLDICSEIGVSVLRDRNGTAVDAAIASAFCIGVVVMWSAGIGGGGFMVVRHPNGTSRSVNFREMAPGAAHRHMFTHDPMLAQRGGLAVGIPGEVMGYYRAWQMYGRVEWRELVEPAIRLAEGGVRVPPFLKKVMESERAWLVNEADREGFGFLFGEDGDPLNEGDVMYRPALGRTLRIIAEKGPKGFYEGEVARNLAKFVQRKGGIVTAEDFGKYDVVVEDTLKVWAFGQEILTCPPPCSGPVLIEGLNIAEGLDMSNDESGLVTHRIIETMKWLSAGRTELGDPRDANVSNIARVAEIQSKEFAARVRRNISDTQTYGWKHYNPSYEFKESHGTTHLSALDAEGMAVALTTTVNLYFGARICDPETGKAAVYTHGSVTFCSCQRGWSCRFRLDCPACWGGYIRREI